MSVRSHRTRTAALPLLLSLASLTLAACGSSSHGSSSSATAPATATSTTPAATSGARGARAGGVLAGLGECLRKNGIPLPRPKAGVRPGVSGLFSGGLAVRLPPGVTPARYRAALERCGAPNVAGRLGRASGLPSRGAVPKTPAFEHALTSFVACMGEHGVKLAPPNFSGRGSVFNTNGVNTKSPQFMAALSKCRSELIRAFRPGGAKSSGAG